MAKYDTVVCGIHKYGCTIHKYSYVYLPLIKSLSMGGGVLAPGSHQNLALISRSLNYFLGAPQINFSLLPKLFLLSPCSLKNVWVAP